MDSAPTVDNIILPLGLIVNTVSYLLTFSLVCMHDCVYYASYIVHGSLPLCYLQLLAFASSQSWVWLEKQMYFT